MTNSDISQHILLHELGLLFDKGKRVVLPVKGKSMLPFLREGKDKVILEPVKELKEGDIVLVHLSNGDIVLHRIFRINCNQIVLMGDGNVYGQEKCTRNEVLAAASFIVRNGIEIDCNNQDERRKVKIWKKLLPFRRYLLFIYKHLFLRIK